MERGEAKLDRKSHKLALPQASFLFCPYATFPIWWLSPEMSYVVSYVAWSLQKNWGLLLTFQNFTGQHINLLWQIESYWWLALSRSRRTCFTISNNRATGFLVVWRKHKPTIPRECLQPCSGMQRKLQLFWLEQILNEVK